MKNNKKQQQYVECIAFGWPTIYVILYVFFSLLMMIVDGEYKKNQCETTKKNSN